MKRASYLLVVSAALAAACGDSSNPTSLAKAPGQPSFDIVANNVDATIDAAVETMSLTYPGANGTTLLSVVPTNGDGKNGCNLTSSTTLVVSVSSSDATVATVSPSSITFTSCGATPTVTVTPLKVGSTTISLSQTSNNTSGTFDLTTATFTVSVAPANTAPTVIVGGVTDGSSYPKGSVPAATCQVTDAQDGSPSVTATLSAITGPFASDGIGSQTATCDYTDAGGLTGSASATYSIVDAAAPSISYVLNPTSADGLNGWYKSSVTLTWTVTGTSLSKTGCVDQNITADQAASTYSCSATNSKGSAGPVTVDVKRDAAAPTVAYTSAATAPNANGWYKADVTATFTATDNLSGFGSSPVSLTTTGTSETSGEGTSVTVGSPLFADNAGNPAAAGTATSAGYKIDKTAPLLSGAATIAPNGNGWYRNDVIIAWTCSDALSGILGGCPANSTISGEGSSLSAGASVSDLADNTKSASVTGIQIDRTAPAISGAATTSPNGNGWYKSSVSVNFTCNDALSGVASCGPNQSLGNEGAGLSVTGNAADNAGNTNSAAVSGINIDKTAPTVGLVGGPANGGTYYFGSVPAAPTCSASDALSGLDGSCGVSGYSTALGSHTVTASATDKAGNTNSASATYTVLAWTGKGFYQPVDMNGTVNTVKAGSTVPLKFELFAGSQELIDPASVKSVTAAKYTCGANVPEDAIEEVVTGTGSTVLRYDATSGQFIYNWKTTGVAGECYRVTMTAQDLTTTISALFKLK